MLVHLRVESAEVVHTEVAECRPFIVNKEASVFDGRLFGYHAVVRGNLEGRHFRRLNIKPVDERGDTEHLRKLEETIYRASLVAAGNYKGRTNNFDLVYFALAVDITCVNAGFLNEFIACKTDDNGVFAPG